MNAIETEPEHELKPDDHDQAHHGGHRHPQAIDEHDLPKDLPTPGNGLVIVVAVVAVALLAGLFLVGWIPRSRLANQTSADAKKQSSGMPTVVVQPPQPEVTAKDIILPANLTANQQTALFARANGFLKQWLVDIGDHVERNQLLAVIDTPDVDAQLAEAQATLEQAKATVIKSQADLQVADANLQRYLVAQQQNPGSVTQETVDSFRAAQADAVGALSVAKATVVQDAAEVQRLTVLQGFELIIAPFPGTITARNYDVGALINPSITTAGTEIFDIAQTDTLRVFVDVPQPDSTNIQVGQPAYLTVRNYPHREFSGVVARQTGALNQQTRTLRFQLNFPNPKGELYAGMYGEARIPTLAPQNLFLIPTSALIFNASGLQIATVRDGKAHIQPVSVGRDFGTQIEATNGVSSDEQVVSNPGENIAEGLSVNAVSPQKATTRP
jgi:RND family efflux transporter MFP subunit